MILIILTVILQQEFAPFSNGDELVTLLFFVKGNRYSSGYLNQSTVTMNTSERAEINIYGHTALLILLNLI